MIKRECDAGSTEGWQRGAVGTEGKSKRCLFPMGAGGFSRRGQSAWLCLVRIQEMTQGWRVGYFREGSAGISGGVGGNGRNVGKLGKSWDPTQTC